MSTVSHAAIRLIESACTSCMACARECPSWCISIDSHSETVRDQPGARARTSHVLDAFAIDWSLCMFCGICIDVCPFDALEWSAEPVPAAADPSSMVEHISELTGRTDEKASPASSNSPGPTSVPGCFQRQ